MIPTPSPSNPTLYATYIYPDSIVPLPTLDYELGGIGISDPSAGLQYQIWTCTLEIDPVTSVGSVYLEAANTPKTFLLSYPGMAEISIAFDQNMRPFLAFFAEGTATYWWYDTLAGMMVFTDLAPGTSPPKACLDDKRPSQLGLSDIILTYERFGNIYYRVQRERYLNEYLLVAGVSGRVLQVGMNEINRLQFMIGQSL